MTAVLKLIFFILLFLLTVWAGRRIFIRLNQHIQDSQTGWQLLGNSLLLFGICAALLVMAIYALVYGYSYMAGGSK